MIDLGTGDTLSDMKRKTGIKGRVLLVEQVERKILLIRGHRVMLDSDLAALYGVGTKTTDC